MKNVRLLLQGLILFSFSPLFASTHFVDLNCINPVAPYSDWSTAATNIQDAVDASADGDLILVTNGIYNTGGRAVNGFALTNRLVIDRAITVQSVNGPTVTQIQGYWVPGTTTGDAAVRCAYLTNNASLIGFTVALGATRNAGDATHERYGGGIWCEGLSAQISDCLIISNSSSLDGGGIYGGSLSNCIIAKNFMGSNSGAARGSSLDHCIVTNNAVYGTSLCTLTNCLVAHNAGEGVYLGSLYNCTVVANGGLGLDGGVGVNSIFYYNTNATWHDVYQSRITNCCLSYMGNSFGPNNITNPPAFVNFAGGNYRLRPLSPGIEQGTNYYVITGTDLDGNPRIVGTAVDMGAYEVQMLVTNTVHYVASKYAIPASPYTNWATAATNIQQAVAVANPGDIVAVAAGIFTEGSVVIYGQETNRVALTNGITLLGVYGPQSTAIVGGRQTRCVYVGSNSAVSGFTITGGQAYSGGDPINEQSGGGIWCETGGAVSSCIIQSNVAYGQASPAVGGGGGIFGGMATNCLILLNTAHWGGGALSTVLYNCTVATNTGGGIGSFNPAITNSAYNSIIYYNSSYNYPSPYDLLFHCCTTPLPQGGNANFTNAPRFVNLSGSDLHLQSNSPCINAGDNAYVAIAGDLDGNTRVIANTVDAGAYEYQSPGSTLSFAWAQQYGIPTDGSADYADTDGDGMNNWQEWRAGTDPTNALSVLQLLSATPTNDYSNATVVWQSVAGKYYSLERASDLSASPAFSTIQSNIIGLAGTTSFMDTNASGSGPFFYRVGVQ